MKTASSLSCIIAAFFALAASIPAQVVGPPTTIDYQGRLLNASGGPLTGAGGPGTSGTAANFQINFRIWNAQSAGNIIWAEKQIVTVTGEGFFSVRLGEGEAIPAGDANPNPSAPQVTNGPGALLSAFDGSERFIGVTVIIPGQAPGEISPRLAFLASPYALVAGKVADGAVGPNQIADGAVGSNQIANGAIAVADLADNAITNAKIANNAVTGAQIANGTIATSDIANNAVTSAKIDNGTIQTADIANNAITGTQIADATITVTDLANNAVTSSKILNGTIATSDIADDAVTAAKLGPDVGVWTVNGDKVYRPNGFVGIGKIPTAKLDVEGSAKISGNLTVQSKPVPIGEEKLRIVRGAVVDGAKNLGSGFSVTRVSKGNYTITFDTAFTAKPIITANNWDKTPSTAGKDNFISIGAVTNSSVGLLHVDQDGSFQDGHFHFMAIGPR